jgi:hypothetical protein
VYGKSAGGERLDGFLRFNRRRRLDCDRGAGQSTTESSAAMAFRGSSGRLEDRTVSGR